VCSCDKGFYAYISLQKPIACILFPSSQQNFLDGHGDIGFLLVINIQSRLMGLALHGLIKPKLQDQGTGKRIKKSCEKPSTYMCRSCLICLPNHMYDSGTCTLKQKTAYVCVYSLKSAYSLWRASSSASIGAEKRQYAHQKSVDFTSIGFTSIGIVHDRMCSSNQYELNTCVNERKFVGAHTGFLHCLSWDAHDFLSLHRGHERYQYLRS